MSVSRLMRGYHSADSQPFQYIDSPWKVHQPQVVQICDAVPNFGITAGFIDPRLALSQHGMLSIHTILLCTPIQ